MLNFLLLLDFITPANESHTPSAIYRLFSCRKFPELSSDFQTNSNFKSNFSPSFGVAFIICSLYLEYTWVSRTFLIRCPGSQSSRRTTPSPPRSSSLALCIFDRPAAKDVADWSQHRAFSDSLSCAISTVWVSRRPRRSNQGHGDADSPMRRIITQ